MSKTLLEVMDIITRPYEIQATQQEYEKVKSYSFNMQNKEEYFVSLVADTWLFFQG